MTTTKAEQGPPPAALRLTLRVPLHTPAGSPLVIELALTNESQGSVHVNARMAANSPYAPRGMREVWFTVEGPAGKPCEFRTKIKIGSAQLSDVQVLAPGATLRRSYELGRDYDLSAPGSYRVRASYGSVGLTDARGELVSLEPATSPWATFVRD